MESIVSIKPTFVYQTAIWPWAMSKGIASSIETYITEYCSLYLTNEALPTYAAALRKFVGQVKGVKETGRDMFTLEHAMKLGR